MLRQGEFRTSDLMRLPRPPMLARVWQGNRVMLASGGPSMVVMDTDGDQVTCWWDDGSGKAQQAVFDIALLTCYGAR